MNCSVCHKEVFDDEPITASIRETFVFKPAHILDEPVTVQGPKGSREVPAAAVLSPDELRERRKDHTRTALSTIFALAGKGPLPEGAFNIRHAACGVSRTGATATLNNALTKHAIRYSRRSR